MLAMACGPILIAFYYAWMGLRVASARKPGTIVPRYEPPEALSPAAVRYAVIGGSDGKTIAAVLAQLAYRGVITLTRNGAGFEVKRTTAGIPADLPHEEEVLLDLVFAYGDPNVIHPGDNQRMDGMVSGLEGALLKRYQGVFSTANYGKVALGMLMSLGLALATPGGSGGASDKVFATVWGLGFSLILFAVLWVRALPAWKDLVHGRLHGRALGMTVFLMPVPLLMAGAAYFAISKMLSQDFAFVVLLLAVINVVGGSRLRAPTPHGRKVLDEIEGYRQFLLTVEQDRLDRVNAPGQPTRLDRHTAYAIALDIKEAWGDHLCDTFFAANVSKG